MIQTEVLVVGSGGAGLRAALEAAWKGVDVLIVDKGRFGKSGATLAAGASVNADSYSCKKVLGLSGDSADSKSIFFEDIIKEGKYINNQAMVEKHVDSAPERIKELVDWGIKIMGLMKAPGHRYPRGVLTTGIEIMRVLIRQVLKSKVKVLEDTIVVDLLCRNGEVTGAVALSLTHGEWVIIEAKAVILATGGGMKVYPIQTAPEGLAGDGQAIAWRAGAELIDMEMVQFLPCCFITPPAWNGISFPSLIGPEGGLEAWLLNKYGERFMEKIDPIRKEKTTRDLLARAIINEVIEGRGSPSGGVFFSFAHLPHNLINWFPEWKHNIHTGWIYQGFNFKELMKEVVNGYAIEVGPASHFFMGGIYIDLNCATQVPGLFAAGEVAGGLHGANRLSGNACTQILVQGKIAGEKAVEFVRKRGWIPTNQKQIAKFVTEYEMPLNRSEGVNAFEFSNAIQKVAWAKSGVVRTGEGLQFALDKVSGWKSGDFVRLCSKSREKRYNREWVQCIQIKNLLTVLEAITRSALLRKETRGAHYRSDYIKMNNEDWLKNTIISNGDGEMDLRNKPVVMNKYKEGITNK